MLRVPEATDIELQEKSYKRERKEESGSQLGGYHYRLKQTGSILHAAFQNWARTQTCVMGIIKWVLKLFIGSFGGCFFPS